MSPHAFSFVAGFAPKQMPERHSAAPMEEAHRRRGFSAPQAARAPSGDPPPRIDAPERVFARPAREIALHSDHPDKPRRLMVSLSSNEHETLGLIAVKKGVTRHQLLRNALDEYLALLVEEYGEGLPLYPMAAVLRGPATRL